MAGKTAYFAGGCFWCITPVFRALPGVNRVISGYSGGAENHPTYAEVKAQKTGHRETIAVVYQPEQISFEKLLSVFLESVDPFDEGGQFIDRGFSYTTAVYYTSEEEKKAVLASLAEIEKEHGRATAVAVEPFDAFWKAEEYHQDYDLKNPEAFERELIESGRKTGCEENGEEDPDAGKLFFVR